MGILKNSKVVAVVTTTLLISSLFWLMNTKRVNGSLEAGLQKEKLHSEALQSEKLSLEKDMQKLKAQLSTLNNKNTELGKLVSSTSAKLKSQESEYNRMKRQNLSLGQLQKQRQELIALQSQLENDLRELRSSNAELEAKNSDLNAIIASLQERNRILTDDLNKAMFAAVDQSQVQAVRGKADRLTVKAKRTRKLIATFEVPNNLKNLSFRILDSKGKALTQKDGTIASIITPSEGSYTASSDAETSGNRLQRVELSYITKEKLRTGVYTVEILNDNLYVASLKVKLK